MSYLMACWYSMPTVLPAPGGMLAIDVVEMLGRSSSPRLPRLPSCCAGSYCAFANATWPCACGADAPRPGGGGRQGEDEAHENQTSTAHRPDYRSPAGDVESTCDRSLALAPATAGAPGAAAASLRNSRCTRRLSSWHSLPGSSHRAPSWPNVTTLIAVSGTPSSTRNCLTACARR